MMNQIQRAVGYSRVSMREQVDGHSLDAQSVNIQNYCKSKGWNLVEIYTDAGLSAKKDSHRPSLEKLMQDAEAGSFDIVVVDKIDRFYRHLHGLLTALDQLNKNHVGFVSVQEQLDFTSTWGKLTLTVLGMLAEIYIQNLGQETRKGKRQRARKGLWNGSIPFGYCRGNCSTCTDSNGPDYCPNFGLKDICESGGVAIHPIESQAVKIAFEKYLSGNSSDALIAEFLNEFEVEGYQGQTIHYRSKGRYSKNSPGLISKDSVRTMLQRVFYTGKIAYYGIDESGNKRRRSNSLEVYDAKHPAIISYEDFVEVQTIRSSLTTTPKNMYKHPTNIFPLSGLLRCGYCGSLMRGVSGKNILYYRDAGQIERTHKCKQPLVKANEIDSEIFKWIYETITNPDDVSIQANNKKNKEKAEERFTRAQSLYLAGELDSTKYENEKVRYNQLTATNPCDTKDLQLITSVSIMTLVNDKRDNENRTLTINKKKALKSVLKALYIRGNAIVGLEPTIAFMSHIRKENDPSQKGKVVCSSGSDGVRTRDLGLDRAAC